MIYSLSESRNGYVFSTLAMIWPKPIRAIEIIYNHVIIADSVKLGTNSVFFRDRIREERIVSVMVKLGANITFYLWFMMQLNFLRKRKINICCILWQCVAALDKVTEIRLRRSGISGSWWTCIFAISYRIYSVIKNGERRADLII